MCGPTRRDVRGPDAAAVGKGLWADTGWPGAYGAGVAYWARHQAPTGPKRLCRLAATLCPGRCCPCARRGRRTACWRVLPLRTRTLKSRFCKRGSLNVRFSNRPFRVKHFQTIRRCSVDVAHGLALLFGIGAKALPLWDSRMRWSNLCSGLAVRRNGRSKRTCELTSSIVPRGTSSTARWSSSFLLLDLIL